MSATKNHFDLPRLRTASLEELATGLDNQRFTSVQLVAAYKRRISEVNDEFNAVLEINPDAEKIAASLDNERRDGKLRGPLHGIPILLKDNIFTDDQTSTSAGSYALLGSRPVREATVATKLRESGAILLGKVNLSEWANFRSGPNNGSNGWSARGRQTYGAFYPGSDPDGSSSGSAISSILGLTFAAIGTETDGSIVSPAQRSSVVGMAPTIGLVARDGIIPLSNRQDTVGPLARTVKSVAYVLTAISGKSPYDNATSSIPFDHIPNYADACQGTRLDGLRIGVPRDAIAETDGIVMKKFDKALSLLKSRGVTIVDNVLFASAKEWDAWDSAEKRACLQAEFKHSIEKWLRELVENPNNINSLSDLVNFTKSEPKECYPERDIQRWEWLQEGPEYNSDAYKKALEKMLRLSGKEGIIGAIEEHKLDLIVHPTNIDPPTTFAARVGLPAITVPLGFYPDDTEPTCHRGKIIDVAPNVPFGITFTGKPFTEELLFRVAHVYESVSSVREEIKPFRMPETELRDVISAAEQRTMLSGKDRLTLKNIHACRLSSTTPSRSGPSYSHSSPLSTRIATPLPISPSCHGLEPRGYFLDEI
ncbi:amidase [Aaosphaeria arxii CBS 175.79]|uniref:Amidase n=1 Tax=Aaosphaeria arxii CBS 175.79 TaxID=1450172 RepID=A0A6A5Y5R8_9PLEO|nr:amidase [Aaosphaeria arxii CBS 175.79]KAF2020553.1 amidase [Aaosphaeria arxii CBS 175.79]